MATREAHLDPSMTTATADPSTPSLRTGPERNSSDGFSTSVRPEGVIANTPISEVEPNLLAIGRGVTTYSSKGWYEEAVLGRYEEAVLGWYEEAVLGWYEEAVLGGYCSL